MTELLFGFTLIFIVYVLYEVFKTVSSEKPNTDTKAPASLAEPKAQPIAAEPQITPTMETKPQTHASHAEKTVMLRNPETGETSVPPTNYRFAKKWIKEALVTEGLLKKIYKNSELTETVNASVKEALEKFKHIEKYQA